MTRFEHGGFSFDYDDDDCDEFVAACHTITRTVAAVGREFGDDYAAEYLAWLVETVLTPGRVVTEGVDQRDDDGPMLRTQ